MTSQSHLPEPGGGCRREGAPGMMTSRRLQVPTWTPLLEGALAEQALTVVRDIAAEIRAGLAVYPSPGDAGTMADDAALVGGRAGVAMLYAYLARAGLGDNAEAVATALLDEAVETLAQVAMLHRLHRRGLGRCPPRLWCLCQRRYARGDRRGTVRLPHVITLDRAL